MEIGTDFIKNYLGKDIYIECTEFLMGMAPEKLFVEFLKDLMDTVLSHGGKMYVKKFESIYSSPAASIFDTLGIEDEDIFVGRNDELNELKSIINFTKFSGKAVMISGEAGIGKTTLVMKARNYALSKGFQFFHSKAYYESVAPYLPFIEAFDKEMNPLLRSKMEERKEDSPEYQRNAMFYDFTQRIKNLAKKNKLFVFFDDIQWIDSSSLKLLHYLIENLRDYPILFICTYREEEMRSVLKDVLSKMKREKLYIDIKLKELKYSEVKEISERMTMREISNKVANRIYHYSGGNPLFVKELVNELGEKLEDTSLLNGSIPDLIKSVVERRLDMLNAQEKKVVKFGAVYGYRVDPDILERAMGIDELELVDAIEHISEVEIWKEDKRGFYTFKERVIRDHIYKKMSGLNRKFCTEK